MHHICSHGKYQNVMKFFETMLLRLDSTNLLISAFRVAGILGVHHHACLMDFFVLCYVLCTVFTGLI
jgi:hypothetical protein